MSPILSTMLLPINAPYDFSATSIVRENWVSAGSRLKRNIEICRKRKLSEGESARRERRNGEKKSESEKCERGASEISACAQWGSQSAVGYFEIVCSLHVLSVGWRHRERGGTSGEACREKEWRGPRV